MTRAVDSDLVLVMCISSLDMISVYMAGLALCDIALGVDQGTEKPTDYLIVIEGFKFCTMCKFIDLSPRVNDFAGF